MLIQSLTSSFQKYCINCVQQLLIKTGFIHECRRTSFMLFTLGIVVWRLVGLVESNSYIFTCISTIIFSILNLYWNCTSHHLNFTSLFLWMEMPKGMIGSSSLAHFPLSDILVNCVCWKDFNLYNVLLHVSLRVADI